MKMIKGFLILTLLITVAAVGLVVASDRGMLPHHPVLAEALTYPRQFMAFVTGVSQAGSLPELNQVEVHPSLATLSERTGEVSSQVGAVLGSAVQVNSEATQSGQSLTQETLEYGQYLYCQRVVNEWEKTH
jgi:hypothetical protein